jgi:putative membrane protein
VIGFVYHDPRLSEGQFMVGRFTITCCVADALAVGMVVAWPEAKDLPDNHWVRVQGAVQTVLLDGQTLPLIDAETVEIIPEPQQPYLFQ